MPLLLLLGACAAIPAARVALPQPRLAPASLAMDVSPGQRLRLSTGGDERAPAVIDAQLDVDAQALRLAGFSFGRRVLMLVWDGVRLDEQRDARWPAQVAAASVLRDIQFVYAPLAELQAAMPPRWRVSESGGRRELRYRGMPAIVIDYATMPRWRGAVHLDNRLEGYRLDIETADASVEAE